MNNKIRYVILGVLLTIVILVLYKIIATTIYDPFSEINAKRKASDKLLAGDYDSMIRSECIQRMKSYGLGSIDEGSINICVDAAKGLMYREFNK
jgi:hypothetical protein